MTGLVCYGLVNNPALAQWDITPSVGVALSYTDNARLERRGGREEFIGQVIPGVTAAIDGRRLNADISYRLTSIFYAADSDRNRTLHYLNANSTYSLLPESVFVDAAAAANRQVIDARQAAPRNNLAVTDNTTDVTTASVSPYWRTRAGVLGEMLLRYEKARTEYLDEDAAGNSPDDLTRDTLRYTLGTIGEPRRISWGLEYDADRVEFDDGTVDEAESISLELDYQLLSNFTVLAVVGDERNDFEDVDEEDTDGRFWQVGFRWGFGRGDFLEYRFGERFFGRTQNLLWSHTGVRFSSDVTYVEDVSDGTQVELIDDPVLGGQVQQISNDIFVSRRLDVALSWAYVQGNYGVDIGGEVRERQRAQSTDDALAITTFIEWRPRVQTSALARLGVRWSRFDDASQEDRLQFVDLEVTRQLTLSTSASGSFSHTISEADDDARGYTENLLTLQLTRTF